MAGTKVAVGFIFCILLPGILQGVGFFKEEWAASPNSTCPVVRLRGNRCGDDYNDIYTLELLPTLVFILPVATVIFTFCGCFNDDDDESDIGAVCALIACSLWLSSIFCVLIFPFAGILILTGCVMFATHFPTEDLGQSFSLCLSAGCLHILGLMYIIINYCYKKSKPREVTERTISVPERQDSLQTVSGAMAYQEETVVYHDESSGVTFFSRKFSFISIFE